MSDPKLTQTEADLMELEAALQIARRGGRVRWEYAEQALTRLYRKYVKNLPKNYEARL